MGSPLFFMDWGGLLPTSKSRMKEGESGGGLLAGLPLSIFHDVACDKWATHGPKRY